MQTLLFHIVYGLLWIVSLLPLRVLYWIFDIVYIFVRRFYRRNVVHDNLVKSFPNKTDSEIAKIERDFYGADEKAILVMARANPAFVLMKDGVVLGKWHYRNFGKVIEYEY